MPMEDITMPTTGRQCVDPASIVWPSTVPIIEGGHAPLHLATQAVLDDYDQRPRAATAHLVRLRAGGPVYRYRRPLRWWVRRRRPFLSMDARRVGGHLTLVAFVVGATP